MGRFFGFGEKEGWACEVDSETGGKRCRKFKATKNANLANGTEVTLVVEPKTCHVHVSGYSTILNDDEDDLNKLAKKMEASCKGGIQ